MSYTHATPLALKGPSARVVVTFLFILHSRPFA